MRLNEINKERLKKDFNKIKNNLSKKNFNASFVEELKHGDIDYVNLIFVLITLFILLFYFFSTYLNMKYNEVKFFSFSDVYSMDKPEDYADFLEKSFEENFHNREKIIENYGGMKKLFNKKFVDDPLIERYIYKGNNGFLYYVAPERIDTTEIARNISSFQDKLISDHTTFVTCLAPNKHTISSQNFPYGALDYTTHNTADFEKNLDEYGVSSLNLSTIFYSEKLDENNAFFANDTHWKFETAFWGYAKLIDYLKNTYMMPINIENKSNDAESYKFQKYPDVYIGSMGKRAGKKYIDYKDDITILFPNFKTDIVYKKYDEYYNIQIEKRGSYKDVFFNEWVLKSDDEYSDKYISLMGYGSPYEVIENKNITDSSKLIMIKDSFAMPVASYLSNNFSKIYLLDTRYPNIRKTLERTIHTVEPDVVLLFVSPTSVTFFPELFNFS